MLDIFQANLEKALPNDKGKNQYLWKKSEIAILESARNLLIDQGYKNFSMRAVGANAGVSLGTVQHHFKNNKRLVIETVKYVLLIYYEDKYSKQLNLPEKCEPIDELISILDFMFEYMKDDAGNMKFVIEILAMALRDKEIAAAVDILYSMERTYFERLIKRINPSLTSKQCAHRAIIVTMLFEGLPLSIGHGQPHHFEFDDLEDEVKARVIDIVMQD